VVFVKCDDLHRSTYKAMRTIIPVVMAFHPDDPFRQKTLLRGGPSHRRALVQMREVDQYLVWSRRLVERAHEAGARRASYIPFACDPMLHHPVPISSEDRGLFAADICFVGNWDAERERWLSELAEEDLALWGSSYWTRCTDERLRSRWKGREVVAHEMAKAVGCARINLNILREQNKDACNMRTFEIPACGGFLLHERSKELAGLLRPGSECDDFSTPNELREKVRYYLQHEDERARIAANGHAGIMRQTYKEWAEQLLQLAESILSERSSPGARASAVRGLEADNPTVSS
jgi:spore maturation protein CgeB